MTVLGIIRHGSTLWNKERRAQGSSNIPLNEDGKKEAEKLALRLMEGAWDCIYVSPLSRALETAQIIQRHLHIPLYKDTRLTEVGGGQIEGTTEQDRIEKWGTEWRDLELGAEKKEDALHRVMALVNDIVNKNDGQRVLVVSHGALISHLVTEMISDGVVDGHIHNTSVTEVIRKNSTWNLEKFNCTLHLHEEE